LEARLPQERNADKHAREEVPDGKKEETFAGKRVKKKSGKKIQFQTGGFSAFPFRR
jgi:hypothetical protein